MFPRARRIAIPAVALAAAVIVAAGPASGGATHRDPDGQIKPREGVLFVGEDVYLFESLGYGSTSPQQTEVTLDEGERQVFDYRIQNDGDMTDRYRISGGESIPGLRVKYFKGNGENVTKAVTKGNFKTRSLDAGQKQRLRVKLIADEFVSGQLFFPITATSLRDAGAIDVVRFGHTTF